MIRAMVVSFCFGAAIARGVKFQDILLITVSIIGFIANLMNLVR